MDSKQHTVWPQATGRREHGAILLLSVPTVHRGTCTRLQAQVISETLQRVLPLSAGSKTFERCCKNPKQARPFCSLEHSQNGPFCSVPNPGPSIVAGTCGVDHEPRVFLRFFTVSPIAGTDCSPVDVHMPCLGVCGWARSWVSLVLRSAARLGSRVRALPQVRAEQRCQGAVAGPGEALVKPISAGERGPCPV